MKSKSNQNPSKSNRKGRRTGPRLKYGFGVKGLLMAIFNGDESKAKMILAS